MKRALFINYIFQIKKLTCVSVCHKDVKKHLLIEANVKNLSADN